MASERKLEKIRRMLEQSGIIDGFDKILRMSVENQLAQRIRIERLFEGEEFIESDKALDDLDKQNRNLMNECVEFYIKKISERKEEIFKEFASIYDKYFDESEIDALHELYSSDIWKKIIELQSVLQRENFSIMSKYDSEATMQVVKFAEEKEKKIRAVYFAKRAYNRAKKCGANNKEALDAYERKYKETMEEK